MHAQVPADGTVTFTLAPSTTPLGTVPVVPTAGSAVAKLTVPFVDGASYGYVAQSGRSTGNHEKISVRFSSWS